MNQKYRGTWFGDGCAVERSLAGARQRLQKHQKSQAKKRFFTEFRETQKQERRFD
ncbi:hypothetical protein [Pseudomonas chlororaphis]|uniref:hypothetical protein n=1 Tax=Pseudomonas chlororaphis TaxID=587753 RepID=UPI0019CFC2F5|nr:hypothetical protein [Pseudomonas chlororaphis]